MPEYTKPSLTRRGSFFSVGGRPNLSTVLALRWLPSAIQASNQRAVPMAAHRIGASQAESSVVPLADGGVECGAAEGHPKRETASAILLRPRLNIEYIQRGILLLGMAKPQLPAEYSPLEYVLRIWDTTLLTRYCVPPGLYALP